MLNETATKYRLVVRMVDGTVHNTTEFESAVEAFYMLAQDTEADSAFVWNHAECWAIDETGREVLRWTTTTIAR